MERTNARTLTSTSLPEPIDLVVIDVSFISLALVLPPVATTLAAPPNGAIVALVKPQFEAGRGRTDHGVVRDPVVHREVVDRVVATAAQAGLGARDVIASPILGPDGNREFLVHFGRGPRCSEIGDRIREATEA
jgi:23S rRNA (cytidine1920-2'-O)/16S rRNA (cytidine1409-2'-O)-methyltransferase